MTSIVRLAGVVLVASAAGVAPAQQPPAPTEPLAIEEQRLHQTYTGGPLTRSIAEPPADWKGRRAPESTVIVRRARNRKGTQELNVAYLLDLGTGVRLRHIIRTDFFTCKGTESIELDWGPDQRESIRFAQSMERCPDFTEEGYAKWARESEAPPILSRTVETSSVRATVDSNEWLAHGNDEIRASISAEFAQVITDELVTLSRVDSFAAEVCKDLRGLLRLECGTGLEAAQLLGVNRPDCDFDASFGEPCSADAKRAFDARKGRSTLNPTAQQR